jgi:glutamate dehydrogenase/leucine dehydrogenase
MGGGKGGADLIQRENQITNNEILSKFYDRIISTHCANTDVPAGDIELEVEKLVLCLDNTEITTIHWRLTGKEFL